MKRFAVILLCLALTVSLCGCVAQSPTTTTKATTTTTTSTTSATTTPSTKWQFRSTTMQADSIAYYKTTINYQVSVIEKDGKYGLVDFDSNIVVPIQYDDIYMREIDPGNTETRLYAYVEKTENAEYELPDAYTFEANGTAVVTQYDGWGYTDGYGVYWYQGKPVLGRESFIVPFTEEEYKQWTDPRRGPGCYEAEAPMVVPVPELLSIDETANEPMVFAEKYALLDIKTQTLITDFIYDAQTSIGFYKGIAALKKDGKWGYVREDGTAITDFIYDNINIKDSWGYQLYYPTNGYIVVCCDSKWGLIDENGNTIIEPIYEGITEVTDKGLFWIKHNGIWQVAEFL